MRYRFSSRAREDYEDILNYTLQNWSHDQAQKYESDLSAALMRLELFPQLGRPSPDSGQNARVLKVNQHLIVYSIEHNVIFISRIIHSRRSPDINLDD